MPRMALDTMYFKSTMHTVNLNIYWHQGRDRQGLTQLLTKRRIT